MSSFFLSVLLLVGPGRGGNGGVGGLVTPLCRRLARQQVSARARVVRSALIPPDQSVGRSVRPALAPARRQRRQQCPTRQGNNSLSGTLPRGLGQITQLSRLDLSYNRGIWGTLPDMS